MTTNAPKTATITLRAGDNTMRLLAVRRHDGSATTFVTTTNGSKETQRGMTQSHATFEEATAALAKLATEAEGLGWSRRVAGRGFVARPDAFTALPTAPKAGQKSAAARK